MDFVSTEQNSTQTCTKLDIKSYGPLNFIKTRNSLDKTTILWNRFCVIVFEKLYFKRTPLIIYTDFLTTDITLVGDSLFCLDTNDFVHFLTIKQKTSSPKFKICAKSILNLCYCDENNLITISKNFDGFSVQLNSVNDGLQSLYVCNISVTSSFLKPARREEKTCSFICKKITCDSISIFSDYFNIKKEKLKAQSYILVYYVENNVYWNILSHGTANNSQNSITIFRSPLPIHSIHFVCESDKSFLVVLKNGSVVKLTFDLFTLKFTTEIIYMYASIHNISISNDTIIYTDSETTWYSFNTFNEMSCSNKQIKLKHVHDLKQFSGKIVYLTYSNLIYIFDVHSKEMFHSKDESDNEFIHIPKNISLSKTVQTDQKRIQKRNKELKEKIDVELKLIKAIALSQHSYLVKDAITFTTHAFSRYDSALEHTKTPILTQNLIHYFKNDVTILHIRLEINKIFTSIFNQINLGSNEVKFYLNIAVTTKNNNILNSSIPLNFPLKKIQDILHPLRNNDTTVQFKIRLKIIAPIRSTLEKSLVFWSVISSNENTITMMNLIKISLSYLDYKQTDIFKHPYTTLCQKLKDNAFKYGGNAFEIMESNHWETNVKSYIKLPKNYVELICTYDNYSKYISVSIYMNHLRKISTEEFKRESLKLEIENHTVTVKLFDNEEANMLEMSGSNLRAVMEMRKLFLYIFYLNDNVKSTKWVVPQIHYTRVEDLKRNLNDELATKCVTMDSMVDIANRFQQYTLGEMPF